MKKRIVALAGIALLLCTGAVARSREEKKKAKEEQKESRAFWKNFNDNLNDYSDITGTPEDSVIFYGGFVPCMSQCMFTQINSDFEPDIQCIDGKEHSLGAFFISKPVKPGSRYMLEVWHFYQAYGYTGTQAYTPQNSPLIFDVPDEPGLYYVGTWGVPDTMMYNELIENKTWTCVTEKPKALKKMLTVYKGTSWIPLIQKELEVATAEAKQYKAERKGKKGDKK